ncbi:hypothetical protein MMPV_005570 [Pyropia vietnamensis]
MVPPPSPPAASAPPPPSPSPSPLPPPSPSPPLPVADEAETPLPGSVLELMLLVGRLKRTKRAGWVLSGIPAPESVSDHMYRMAVAAFALPPAVSAHAMKLALVHDLAEALVGDITPHDGVSSEEKEQRERAAMVTIRDEVLGGGAGGGGSQRGGDPAGQAVGAQLMTLWEEYEAGETPAAALVKDVDKYEMVVQAYEYEKATGKDLSPFFDSTAGKFRTPTVRGWAEPVYAARAAARAAAAATAGGEGRHVTDAPPSPPAGSPSQRD